MPPVWALLFFASLFGVSSTAATLEDIDGNQHALPPLSGAKATVVFFVTHDCPISNRYAPEIARICNEYSSRGVGCLMAYVDPTLTAHEIREHRQAFGGSQPAVHDKGRELVELAGATITPESAVFDGGGRLVYRGRVNNFYAALGTPRRQATEHDLRNALDQLLAGEPVSKPRTQAVGCFIPKWNVVQEGESL